MSRWEKWATAVMLMTAVVGTIWYLYLELQREGDVSLIGWSVIIFVWFVILRRLIHLWARARRRNK